MHTFFYALFLLEYSNVVSLGVFSGCGLLPSSEEQMIPAYDTTNDIIYIFGGDIYGTQLISFNLSAKCNNDPFEYIGVHVLSSSMSSGLGQGYAQNGDLIYYINNYINDAKYTLLSYNISTISTSNGTYNSYNEIGIVPINTYSNKVVSCIAYSNINGYIIISDGTHIQIYDTNVNEWIVFDASNMIQRRIAHSCVVYNNYFYNIGGLSNQFDHKTALKSVETFYIGNVNNGNLIYSLNHTCTLYKTRWGLRS
eukprot:127962_1